MRIPIAEYRRLLRSKWGNNPSTVAEINEFLEEVVGDPTGTNPSAKELTVDAFIDQCFGVYRRLKKYD